MAAIPNPKAVIERIAPKDAQALLGTMTTNRALNRRKVAQFAGALTRGEWRVNGEAVIVDSEGRLIDGQHRLQAVIESKVPMTTIVVRGVQPEAYDTIDLGKSRTLTDVFQIRGIGYAARTASALRHLYAYRTTGTFHFPPVAMSVQQGEALLEACAGFGESVRKADTWLSRAGIGPLPLFGCLHYMFSEIDPSDADLFLSELGSGVGLNDTDPVYLLREKMIANRRATQRLTDTEVAALTIKAWNAYRGGTKIRRLQWVTGGKSAEAFPTPV